MKYIRTEDGHRFIRIGDKIYDLENMPNDVWFDGTNIKDSDNWDSANIYTNCFDGQANTVYELCDFVYVLWCDNTFDTYDLSCENLNLEKEYFQNLLLKGEAREVYVGIKTNKGLIFVAQMKNEGNLELL